MLRKFMALAALATMTLATIPSHAANESANYVAAQAVVVGTPRPAGSPTPRLGIGGYTFQGRATAPLRVTVKDASGVNAGIAVMVCAGGCDAATGGLQKGFCTNASGVATLTGIPAGKSLRVGVHVIEPGATWQNVGECEGIATTGTVTLTW